MRTDRQRSGDAAEAAVVARLTAAGWVVLARNVRVGRRELDVVAVDPGPPRALVVVEVRWRARRDFGLAEETFGWRKRRYVRDAAFGLLDTGTLPDGRPLPHLPLRFDLVLVEPATGIGEPDVVRHHRHVVGR
jgi:putative endonuclease